MAFQDFDEITERRRTSNEQKFRRRVIIAVVSGVALLALIGAGVFAIVTHLGAHKAPAEVAPQAPSSAVSKTDKVVKFICNATDYKDKCETTLSKAVGPSGSPREFLVTAIKAAKAELHKAFGKASSLKFNTPQERGAFEDCEGLMEDAMDELEASVSSIGNGSVSAKAPDLNSWLSAVISYQQTCVDGFPEGKLKSDMARLFKTSREFTSNSLALVTEVSSFLSAFQMVGLSTTRHLLEEAVPAVSPPAGSAPPQSPVSTPAAPSVPASTPVGSGTPLALTPGGSAPPATPAAPVSTPEAPAAPASTPGSSPPASSTPVSTPAAPAGGSAVELDALGFPAWMEEDDRRMLKAGDDRPTPNVTVAKDGSGQFKTINESLAAMPLKYEGRYVIYIKEGIYEETVIVTKKMLNVTMYGDGSQKTVITGNKNFVDGVRTFLTATFVASGDGFMARGIGFRNTAGPEKHQAVAARIQSDRAIFVNCRFDGYQDTLYAQAHRQFYRSCVISGTVDFIFGDAASVFQNCLIVVRRPLDNQQNIITAQGRTDKQQTTGIVLHACRIFADRKLDPARARIRSYLGRPWKEFSRTIIMESTISDVIHPDGWLPWEGDFALKTLYYAEFSNKGPGAGVDGRVKWPGYNKAITKEEASQYTVENFLQGDWISGVKGVPVRFTLYDS